MRHDEAKAALVNRGAKVDAVAEEIEGNLTLLGATAIEDKLQEVDAPPPSSRPAFLDSPRILGNWEVPRDTIGVQTGGPSNTFNTETQTQMTDRIMRICLGQGEAGDMLAQDILDRSWSCQGYICR